MALLKNVSTGLESVVRGISLIGRSPAAHIKLSGRGSSTEHASVRWLGAEWILRDLGSLNGTRVNDRLLVGREWSLLNGDVIVFGDPCERWCWLDGSPPSPRAVAPDGTVQEAVGNRLVLWDDQVPLATIYPIGERWELDTGGSARTVSDGEVVEVGARRFRLEMPDLRGALDRTRGLAGSRKLSEASLEFRVSQDEEQVDMKLVLGDRQHELPSRACYYTLLVLSRLRHAEQQAGVPEDEAGWIYSNDLAERLGQTPEKLNVDVHRIRQILLSLDAADDVENIVERRRTSGQLRVGTAKIVILKPKGGTPGPRPP